MSSFLQAGRPPLILASASKSRARMLEAAGLAFIVEPPGLDESAMRQAISGEKALDPHDVAEVSGQSQSRGGQRPCPSGLCDRRRPDPRARQDHHVQARQHGGGAPPAARSQRQDPHAAHRGRRGDQRRDAVGRNHGRDADHAQARRPNSSAVTWLPPARRCWVRSAPISSSRSAFSCSTRSTATISPSLACRSSRSSTRFGARASSKADDHETRLRHRLAGRAFPLTLDPSLLAHAIRH